MVVICLPSASLTGTLQERVATPSIWTVQAPHWAMPQPYLVPVSPTFSRIAHSSGVSGSTSMVKVLLLTVRFAIAIPLIGPSTDGLARQFVRQNGTIQIKKTSLRRRRILAASGRARHGRG